MSGIGETIDALYYVISRRARNVPINLCYSLISSKSHRRFCRYRLRKLKKKKKNCRFAKFPTTFARSIARPFVPAIDIRMRYRVLALYSAGNPDAPYKCYIFVSTCPMHSAPIVCMLNTPNVLHIIPRYTPPHTTRINFYNTPNTRSTYWSVLSGSLVKRPYGYILIFT